MTRKITILQRSLIHNGERNAYETKLYHGLLVAGGEAVESFVDERIALVQRPGRPRLGYIYNLASGALVTQPVTTLVVNRSVATVFEDLRGWKTIGLDDLEYVEIQLSKVTIEGTEPLRLSEIWPNELLKGLPRTTPEQCPIFDLLASPHLQDIVKTEPEALREVSFNKFAYPVNIPQRKEFFEHFPAFTSGTAHVFREDVWMSIQHLFPPRYWHINSTEIR